jgi:hypothetical protein
MPTVQMVDTDDTSRSGTYAPADDAKRARTHHHNTRPAKSTKQVRYASDVDEKQNTYGSDDGSGDNFDQVSDPDAEEYGDDDGGGGKLPSNPNPPKLSPPQKHSKVMQKKKPQRKTYSGLGTAAKALLNSEDHDELLYDDLRFQQNPGGEASVFKTFKAEVLQHSGLVVFAFMRPGASSLHLIHSPQTYITHRNDDDLKGKDIAFAGDRTHLQPSPPAIVLSEKSPWSWITKPFNLDQSAMESFYADDSNKNKLWTPPASSKQLKHTSFPRLLFLPTVFVPYCAEQPRTPFELHQFVIQYITTTETAVTLNDCTRLLNWCLAAAHSDMGGNNSWLAYPIEAAISNNPRFYQWTNRRLINIFGELPGTTSSPGHPTADNVDWSAMGNQLRAGIVEGLRPMLTASRSEDTTAPAATNPNKGKDYDEQQWYMLMGFAQVSTPELLPELWAGFTQTKNSDAHRIEIGAEMRRWEESHRIPIVQNMEFSDRTLNYIVKMQFNPPGCSGTTYYSSIDKGLTILSCRPPEGEELEAIRDMELKELQAEGNRTLADILSVPAIAGNIKPAEDYHELHLNLGTFCALLHSLFGHKCDYYVKCLLLWRAMADYTIFANRRLFSPLLCRQITWAIIEDGRRYFSRVMTRRHFERMDEGEAVDFPMSHLDAIKDSIMNQTPIMRPSFPNEWRGDWQGGKKQKLTASSPGVASIMAATAPTAPTTIVRGSSTPSVISGISMNSAGEASGQAAVSRQRRSRQQGVRETDIHPSLKALMAGHLRENQYIQLGAVLRSAHLTFDNLPTLPKYMLNGRNTLCYNYVLGNCSSKFCNYRTNGGHAPVEDITNDFANRMIQVLENPLGQWNTPDAKAARDAARASSNNQ